MVITKNMYRATLLCLLLLSHAPIQAQFTLEIKNEEEYKRAKAKFPTAKYVDLSRKTTVTLGKAPADGSEPFTWEYETKFERISVSNERSIRYQYGLNDFIEVEGTNFWMRDKKELEPFKMPPTIIPVEDQGVFHSNYRVHSFIKEVDYPGSVLGGIVRTRILSIPYGGDLNFVEGVPAEEVTWVIELPEDLKVRFEKFNFENYQLEEKKVVKGKTVVYTFTLRDVPAATDEKWTPGAQHYLPFILLIPEELSNGKGKPTTKLYKEAADVYAWNKKLADKAPNRPEKLRPLVTELTAGKTEEQKLATIYYWVQQNIRYIAFLDGWAAFVPDACQNVLEKRYGDCKGKANLLKEMLVLAGFDARLVWIGTREHSPLPKSVPTIASSNHMIAAVRYKNSWLFLDGTASFQPLHEIPDFLQGQEVMIEGKGKKDFEIYQVPAQPSQQNAVTNRFELNINPADGSLEGIQKQQLRGYSRSLFRIVYNKTPLKDQPKLVERYMSAGQSFKGFSDLKYQINDDFDKPINLQAKVLFQGQATLIDKEIYLPTSIYNQIKAFQLPEKRDAAVTLDYKRYYSDTLRYTIPAGYKVTSMPQKVAIVRPKYKYDAQAQLVNQGKVVEIIYTIELSDYIIKKPEFDLWNQDVKTMKAFLSDQIIIQNQK